MLTNLLLFAVLLLIATATIKLWSLDKQIMATKADLDAAIAALPATLQTALDAAIQPIIAAIQAKVTTEDFSSEIASLQELPASVSQQVATDLTPKA